MSLINFALSTFCDNSMYTTAIILTRQCCPYNISMNYIWTIIVTVSALLMTANGQGDFLACAIEGVGSAFATTVSMLAVYCVWNGIFQLLEDCGLLHALSKRISPLVNLLFDVKGNEKAQQYLTLNISANLLGVSNASTPSAINAMQSIEKDNTKLSYSGAMLFVFNACGVQLVPSTAMGIRASLGSTTAYDTMLVTFISSFVTLFVGIVLVNLAYRRREK